MTRLRAPQPSTPSGSQGYIQDLSAFVSSHRIDLGEYEKIRRHIHANPDLSEVEGKTMEFIASHLRELGSYKVTTGIGGYGLAALLENGDGPVVLLRSDTDGLPVREQSGLPYASKKTMKDAEGIEQPTMHACGHDIHMSCLLAVAKTLLDTREHWRGTLELVFQPAEERLLGARHMVEDGLFNRVLPVPDVLLGQHVFPDRAGNVAMRSGPAMAASDSLQITFYGRGSHASQPQNSIDPIVMASAAVQRLQGIVSREVSPLDSAVVTVASIHGGEAENVIADSAFIRVNIRTLKASVRTHILDAIRRIVDAEATASGASKMPLIEVMRSGQATYNSPKVWEHVSTAFRHHFGDKAFKDDIDPIMGSEDFGILGASINRPSLFWIFGGTDPAVFDKAVREGKVDELPTNHSPFFAPAMQPTLQVGVDAFVTAALAYLG